MHAQTIEVQRPLDAGLLTFSTQIRAKGLSFHIINPTSPYLIVKRFII
jgi:hypothetical protein